MMLMNTLVGLFLLTAITCKHYLVDVEKEEDRQEEEGSDYSVSGSQRPPDPGESRPLTLRVFHFFKEFFQGISLEKVIL